MNIRSCILVVCVTAAPGLVLAGPGAHGPNGEHLDGSGPGITIVDASPRVEAHSEAFELVARLVDQRLAIMIDRYETNEPVLDAKVEVETDAGHAVTARFVASDGSYVVDDAKLIEVISKPGEHSLVFTLAAGADTDLLDGTLAVGTGAHPPGTVHWRNRAIMLALALLVMGAAVVVVRRRRYRDHVDVAPETA